MTTLLNTKKLNLLAKALNTRENTQKENLKINLNGLSQDTFELRSNKTKGFSFTGKSTKLSDVEAKVDEHKLENGLKPKYINLINDGLKSGKDEKVNEAINLSVKIGTECGHQIYNKLAKDLIKPLLKDTNPKFIASGISILNQIGRMPQNNKNILDHLIEEEPLNQKPNLAGLAIGALATIGSTQYPAEYYGLISALLPKVKKENEPSLVPIILNGMTSILQKQLLFTDQVAQCLNSLDNYKNSQDRDITKARIFGYAVLGDKFQEHAPACINNLAPIIINNCEQDPKIAQAALKVVGDIGAKHTGITKTAIGVLMPVVEKEGIPAEVSLTAIKSVNTIVEKPSNVQELTIVAPFILSRMNKIIDTAKSQDQSLLTPAINLFRLLAETFANVPGCKDAYAQSREKQMKDVRVAAEFTKQSMEESPSELFGISSPNKFEKAEKEFREQEKNRIENLKAQLSIYAEGSSEYEKAQAELAKIQQQTIERNQIEQKHASKPLAALQQRLLKQQMEEKQREIFGGPSEPIQAEQVESRDRDKQTSSS